MTTFTIITPAVAATLPWLVLAKLEYQVNTPAQRDAVRAELDRREL